MSAPDFPDLESLTQWMTDHDITGMWNSPRMAEEVKPSLWKWDDLQKSLMGAAQHVTMDMVAMRTIQPRNPGLRAGLSQTLHFSVQCLLPGERTKAHRNLVSETRFVLQAPKGAVFIVDGEAFPMETGDLITTPNWSWHDHYNGGDEPAIWLDGMDTRMVGALGKSINEKFPTEHQPVTRPSGYSTMMYGPAKPTWISTDQTTPPPFRYPWKDTESALLALKESETEGDPHDGLHLTFSNPLTGGATLPTYACEIQLLTPHVRLQTHRHNSTTIYHAFRGSGVTIVDGERLEWSQGDIFVVPPWTWHQHENRSSEEALLYSIADRPAMMSLGLYREEQQ